MIPAVSFRRIAAWLRAAVTTVVFSMLLWQLPAASGANTLVGWWPFDEGSGITAFDKSGFGNTGTLHGGCSYTRDALVGTALMVSCLDGSVSVNHSKSLEPETGTLQAWIKLPMLQDSDIAVKTSNVLIRTMLSNGTYHGVYGLRITANGGAGAYVLNDDPATPGAPWRFANAPAGSIQAGKWHHLVLRWDGRSVAIFVNGVLKAQTAYLAVPGFGLSYGGISSLVFAQGTKWADNARHEFLGQIEDVRFYNYARSSAQIATDWQQRAQNQP